MKLFDENLNLSTVSGIVSLPWQTLPDTVDKFKFSSKVSFQKSQ